MVDETTDSSNREQAAFCMRWVDQEFQAHEDFIGLYQLMSGTSANSIMDMIRDVMLRLNLSFAKLRGQCYDGASSMSGIRTGVATQISKEEPRAVYTHCYGHSLNLACSDTIKQCKVIKDCLDVTYEITKLIKKSPKRDAILTKIKEQISDTSPGVRTLCPTRWTIKAKSLKSILSNYQTLQLLWEESLNATTDHEMKCRIRGVASYMESFDFFFGVTLGELILCHSDNLSMTLQSPNMSAAEAQQVVSMTVKTLKKMRSAETVKFFWTNTTRSADELGVNEPTLPRKRRMPKRFEVGNSQGEFHSTAEDHYRQIYYEALDLIISCIENRFNQPGYNIYRKLQDLLLKCVNGISYEEEFQFVSQFYHNDLNSEQLRLHLQLLQVNFESGNDSNVTVHLQSILIISSHSPLHKDVVVVVVR